MRSLSILTLILFLSNQGYCDVKFKTNRIEKEYNQLFNQNIELYQIVSKISFLAKTKFNKNIVITEVYRTQEEQDRYYKGKKKFRSPHQDWLAIDLRSKNLTKSEIKYLVNNINETVKNNTYIPTAFYHDIGLGKHIHIQFKERK